MKLNTLRSVNSLKILEINQTKNLPIWQGNQRGKSWISNSIKKLLDFVQEEMKKNLTLSARFKYFLTKKHNKKGSPCRTGKLGKTFLIT